MISQTGKWVAYDPPEAYGNIEKIIKHVTQPTPQKYISHTYTQAKSHNPTNSNKCPACREPPDPSTCAILSDKYAPTYI